MGRTIEYHVILTEDEKFHLKNITSTGKSSARSLKRAMIILKADRSENSALDDERISQEVGCSLSTVRNVKLRFAKGERLKALEEKERSGRPRHIDGELEAHIIATACSSPPEGRVRWTLHLIADKVAVLTEDESCSHMSVARVLKKTNLSLG